MCVHRESSRFSAPWGQHLLILIPKNGLFLCVNDAIVPILFHLPVCVWCDQSPFFDGHLCLGAAWFDHQRILVVQLCIRVGFFFFFPLFTSQKSGDPKLRDLRPEWNVFLVKGTLLFFFLRLPEWILNVCCCEDFLQTASWLLKHPHLDLPWLEKLSNLLQKLSAIR